ncbi:MAG: sn-glycerol-1-phosphate dehydrogenase [Ruminococcaceae bacterium]|nr:sn-glycerol-1-phosphate dehydrogenase [Oscillospiraceae bacterium]
MNIIEIINGFRHDCPCGRKHTTTIRDVRISSGIVHEVGSILKENGFSRSILLVADKNTLAASEGISDSLADFLVEYKIYDNLRVATMENVSEIEKLIRNKDISVLSVGSGSLNDICRLAAARHQKKLCIFATAPSMDGFASFSAPIVSGGFKSSYPAKSPEVIIGDTNVLANAPARLKSAGFGDMIAKYIALVDWNISVALTGEYYCDKIADLTRSAVDELMEMADKVTINDEYTAGKIFEALLKTGIGMSFSQNSRPASGSEHVIAHLMECIELRDGKIPNFHGEDVGVCTLEMLKLYNDLALHSGISTHREHVDWNDVYAFYGNMADDVRKLNEPDNIVDCVDEKILEQRFGDIVDIIHSVPKYEQCRDAMIKAGCKITVEDIGKSHEFFVNCVKYSPYMRRRITLTRLLGMITPE